MKWFLALAVTLAVAVAACAGQPDVTPPPAQSATALAGEVYVDAAADHAFRVIEPISGRVVRTLPAGTPSPDWRRLYRLSAGALEVLDPLTGSLASTHPAPGWAQAVWTSANGRWLVFSQSGAGDRFQVQDAGWSAAPVSVDLHGSFTFDGISGDGQRLFLLERQDADHYQVRMYDVPGHALAPYVIVDKTDPSEPMSGRAVAGYATGDGEMQLTLYQRAKDHAFVHALPIGEAIQVAYCVDLPGPSEGWAFAPAPDGRRFYAVNVSAGRVVELTARNDGPPDLRQARIEAGTGQPAVAVAPDGATIYVGSASGVVALDSRSLGKVVARGQGARKVTALAAARGGVYAVTGGTRLVRLDPRSLAVLGEVPLTTTVGAILRVS